ncbi:CRISPR-associated helicase Cas3' [Haliovirga abyssi]|uniref:CRISPR-associated helicase/endonuclease Cas3 n=1 Tax=Haliovirga abyssi TaxID=2996794 RepID=A0AAU9DQW7_9FUSO|nr:CRISPR-associated helicase Cas3' [Haliovirga abyssi]BDU50908.1 CRISPR-associated helicase/endonuclease Cas3 [Haliovirga abyssi]
MNNYLAKSNPRETIQEHTDNLLRNFEIIKSVYSDLDINWNALKISCIYHDLGKINRKFQDKIEKIKKHKDEIAHNLLSLAFINAKELKEEYNFTNNEIKIISQAVARHHERGDYNAENYNEEVELLKKEAVNFKYDKLEIKKIKKISAKYFANERTYGDSDYFLEYVKIKGLLNRLDYAASGGIDVEVKNDFLNDSLDKFKKENNFNWNDLQNFMKNNLDKNIIAVAQTGMGKTEAGLLWIGNNKGFFTLPLKTAINEIYKRVVNEIVKNKERIGLLHSDTYSKYLENKNNGDNIEEYYNKTKQLSLPLTICTLDQIFDFVFRYRDFESKLATLSYSKVVIDEIQMYSPDLLAYLILGLYYIDKIGGKFAILTATLPQIIIDLMKKEGINFITGEKPYINSLIRHSIKVRNSEIDSREIIEKYNKNKVLVICNTVRKAQEIFEELSNNKELIDKKVKINLLHSKFIKRDRKNKEKNIMRMGDKNSNEIGIWVATQVVEASLDIDFDLLFTELSDINGLFQRFGRCYRKRAFDKNGYNCYVFDGGENKCSGVNYVIDKDIFEFSKEALKNLDGKITEQDKLDIIGEIYTTEKLKNTEYYKKVLANIDYIKTIPEYELSKKEVRKRFRDIENITIIPKTIYEERKDAIDELILDINRAIYNNENRKEFTENRIKKIYELKDYTVDIRRNEIYGIQLNEKLKIGKYMEIPILDCKYSEKEGVTIEKKVDRNIDFDSRSF